MTRRTLAISESNNAFGNGTLAPGGKRPAPLCWDNPGESGTYVVLWQPDQFSSDAAGRLDQQALTCCGR